MKAFLIFDSIIVKVENVEFKGACGLRLNEEKGTEILVGSRRENKLTIKGKVMEQAIARVSTQIS